MSRNQNISWNVQTKDLAKSPLGYMVNICEDVWGSNVLCTHNTSEKTNEFEVSMNGDGIFTAYPTSGITGATTRTVVRMLRNGETPKSVLLLGSGSSIYKMSLDCSHILLEKEICENGKYFIQTISCDKTGKIWIKDSANIMTILNQEFKIVNTFGLPRDCVFAAVDPLRRLLWQITKTAVNVYKTHDMSIAFSRPVSIYEQRITSWDISSSSGTLFLTCEGSTALSITLQGVITPFSSGATGICQWGARGALVCKPNSVDYFNGIAVSETYAGELFGIENPERIASSGKSYFVISDSTGLSVKVDDQMNPKWFIQPDQISNHVDVKISSNATDLGGIIYLYSYDGAVAYRDMVYRGTKYGSTSFALPFTDNVSNYPVATVVPDLTASHVWAEITPIFVEESGIGIMKIGDDFIIN